MQLNVEVSDELHRELRQEPTTDDVAKWFQVEDDDEKVDALCSDITEMMGVDDEAPSRNEDDGGLG